MSSFKIGKQALHTSLRGHNLLRQPLLNKGTAFSAQEQDELGLRGLLPEAVETLEEQVVRAYQAYKKKGSDLGRHIYLRSLQDRNETLFYKLLTQHISEMLPIVYTPTVGLACQEFHEIYRQPRGLFISYPEREKMDEMISHIDLPDVKVIVVTDGERILGLGDQGVGGMGIPIGKISLYTACGGIYPGVALPVVLDVGTDNPERMQDPMYLGWKHTRIRGAEYDQFIDRFVKAVLKRYPNVLLQWEDFSKANARPLLDRYQDQLCTFNDDIQGTAAVTLAGILAAVKVNQGKLKEQRIVIYGAGSAGTGIADQIALAMGHENIWMIDRVGLLVEGMHDLASFQKPYAQPVSKVKAAGLDPTKSLFLEEVVEKYKPHILIGVSGCPHVFNEAVIRKMAAGVERPIVFPLSNPTSQCEANPADVVRWANGQVLIGTGTQFPDVPFNGKVYKIGQCNNYYIFPAMGLAVVATHARRVTSGMFLAAADALSGLSPALKHPENLLFPEPEQVRTVAKTLAFAIGTQAQKEGVAPKISPEALKKAIEENFWEPKYWPVSS